jgi:plasmid maintenance system killer protein
MKAIQLIPQAAAAASEGTTDSSTTPHIEQKLHGRLDTIATVADHDCLTAPPVLRWLVRREDRATSHNALQIMVRLLVFL